MTVVLGYVEIDRFKAEKEALYFTTVKRLAQYEVEFSKLKTEFWSYILENHNLSSIWEANKKERNIYYLSAFIFFLI